MSSENLLLESTLIRPECLDLPSAWIGHIPFAHWLGMEWSPRCFVELGTHWGHSFFNVCAGMAAANVEGSATAVDTWEGDDQAGFFKDEVYRHVEHLREIRYPESTRLLRSAFDDALSEFADGSIDLLHVDGCHRYESVKKDFENWQPKLAEGALVLFHDTQVRQESFGVWKYWKELTEKVTSFLEFPHSNGLGVLYLSEKNVPDWLIKGSPEQQRVLEFFQARGELLMAEWKHNEDTFRFPLSELTKQQSEDRQKFAELHRILESTQLDMAEEERRNQGLQRMLESTQQSLADTEIQVLELQELVHSCREREQAREEVLNCRIGELQVRLDNIIQKFLRYRNSGWWMCFRFLVRVEEKIPLSGKIFNLPIKLLLWTFTGNIRKMLRAFSESGRCLSSGYLDLSWYLQFNPDIQDAGLNPALHWCSQGWREGRDPGPRFSVSEYYRDYPEIQGTDLNPLVHCLSNRQAVEHTVTEPITELDAVPCQGTSSDTVESLIRRELPSEVPLRFRSDPVSGPRVTLVTDSVNSGSLFGGVATALVFGVKLANARRADLRILTLLEPPDRANPLKVMDLQGVRLEGKLEFDFADEGRRVMPEREGETFMTTSWWTTRMVRKTVPPDRILYLLQEDERMFYPMGDMWLRCSETLGDPEVRTVVNSELLYESLCESGFSNLRKAGTFFEPAFVPSIYHPSFNNNTEKPKRFFFYARPLHARNLFLRGLEVVAGAIESGILRPSEWEIVFAGCHLPHIELPGGLKPVLADNLPWEEYAEFVRGVDLGLSLMSTPHPSYPPLDLAACGAVVVTNRFANKQQLNAYSGNILCVNSDVTSLIEGVRRGVERVSDPDAVREVHASNQLLRDWEDSFRPVLNWVENG